MLGYAPVNQRVKFSATAMQKGECRLPSSVALGKQASGTLPEVCATLQRPT